LPTPKQSPAFRHITTMRTNHEALGLLAAGLTALVEFSGKRGRKTAGTKERALL
jgi:hypothetical protein